MTTDSSLPCLSHVIALRVLNVLRGLRHPTDGRPRMALADALVVGDTQGHHRNVLVRLRSDCLAFENTFRGVNLKDGSVTRVWPALAALLVQLNAVQASPRFRSAGQECPGWARALFDIEVPADPRLLYYALEHVGGGAGAEREIFRAGKPAVGAWLDVRTGPTHEGLRHVDPVLRYRHWEVLSRFLHDEFESEWERFTLELLPDGKPYPATLEETARRFTELQAEKASKLGGVCQRFVQETAPAFKLKKQALKAEVEELFYRCLSTLTPEERQKLRDNVRTVSEWGSAVRDALDRLRPEASREFGERSRN